MSRIVIAPPSCLPLRRRRLPLPTAIMPLPLPPPNTHRRHRHRRPSIAPCCSSHAATHPLLSNLTACQGACWWWWWRRGSAADKQRRRRQEARQWRTIDGNDVYRRQETVAAAAAADDKLEGRQPPMRDCRDSWLATMTVAAYSNLRGRRWQRMTMALNNDGTRVLMADDDGEGTRPGGNKDGIRHLLVAKIPK